MLSHESKARKLRCIGVIGALLVPITVFQLSNSTQYRLFFPPDFVLMSQSLSCARCTSFGSFFGQTGPKFGNNLCNVTITMPKSHCSTCGRSFKSAQYYIQHLDQRKNRKCRAEFQLRLKLFTPPGPNQKTNTESVTSTHTAVSLQSANGAQRSLDFAQQQDEVNNDTPNINDNLMDWENEEDEIPQQQDETAPPQQDPVQAANIPDNLPNHDPSTNAKSSFINETFKEFVQTSLKNRSWVDTNLQAGIELMNVLHQNGIVSLYDTIMDWHVTYLEAKKRVTKTQLFEKLRKRYNMEGCTPYETTVTLPSSQVVARVPCHDAWSMVMDLLTDPRIVPDDYLWFDDDPFGNPPAEWIEMADINDGLAYRRTYEQLILPQPFTNSGRRRVLLPVICYMDGCVTGFNENLAIEFMKFTFGIFNSKARDKDYVWRNLGAVPQFQKVRAKAAQQIQKSGHVDALEYLSVSDSDVDNPNLRKFTHDFDYERYINSSDNEEEMCNVPIPETDAQDLHVILQVIMDGMKQIFRTGGFEWDFFHRGSVKRVQLIPFLLFIKGDTVEHDKFTGRYGARNKGVKSLCRYCTCPTDQVDNPYADHPRKTPQMISELIRKRDMDGLKQLSQQFIFNMWYEFGFGLHNQLSIHGACPMELLHWIQLGMYKYSRSTFFERLGPYSEISRTINTIASEMGWVFQRQSDRDIPRTKYTKGIQRGVLMAHEMTGLMLVLIATLRSTGGRAAILADNNTNFPDEQSIENWIMLLELQIEFEAWLKSKTMSVAVVIRLRTKVRELMNLTKLIGNRQKGMQYKTNNFHSTKHVPDDILMFGPPHCVNTKSNEMHHKADKKSAKMTQKRPDSFDFQCTQRVDDRRVIEMAIEELKGRPKWDYFHGFQRQNQHKSDLILAKERKQRVSSPKKSTDEPILTGVKAVFRYDEGKEEYVYRVESEMQRKNRYQYGQEFVGCIADLTEEVVEYVKEMTVFSELDLPDSSKFRASPYFQGKPWYDWAIARVGTAIEGFEQRKVPVQIRGFVDLRALPPDNGTKYVPGVYMIVEPTRLNPDMVEVRRSDIFVSYLKEAWPNGGIKREILPIENIESVACVIPDIAHESKRAFFRVRPPSQWTELFETWVNSDHLTPHVEPDIGE